MWTGPTRVSSFRLREDDWQWVKAHPRMEFSALLAAKIHEMQLDETTGPLPRFIREARKLGLTDEQLQPLLQALRARNTPG